jgi:hypothetical protein
MNPGCFLAAHGVQERPAPCDGRLVRCHLIPKRMLKEVWRSVHNARWPYDVSKPKLPATLDQLIWDPRTWVLGCGGPMGNAGHHGMLDTARTLRLPRECIPTRTELFARELGLAWWMECEYPARTTPSALAEALRGLQT